MLVVLAAYRAHPIVLSRVGIEHGVAEKLEHAAVIFVVAGLERGVHQAAVESSELGVVGVGHHLEFLHRLHVRRQLPGTVFVGNRCAVEQELVRACTAPVDFV